MHNQLRAVALDDGARALRTEDMRQVRANLEGGDGRKERRTRVLAAASQHRNLPCKSPAGRLRQGANWVVLTLASVCSCTIAGAWKHTPCPTCPMSCDSTK